MGVRGTISGVQPFVELSQGAITLVYKGYQRSLDRFVLLKMLRPEFSGDEALARRFAEEARLAAKIQHPNVVAVYDFGQEDAESYIIAEFVEGVSLAELLEERGRMPAELAAFVLLGAARGLQAAHSKGILHRDIKPSNLLVSYEGQVKLTDFGMASLTSEEDGEVRGTMAYFAPEGLRGEGYTEASDLFALGATLFEMLTGRRAFQGADARELLDAVLHHDPIPFLAAAPGLPPALLEITRRLLAKDPHERYEDAAALSAALEAYRAGSPRGAVGTKELKVYLDDPEAYRARAAAERALPVRVEVQPPMYPVGGGLLDRFPLPAGRRRIALATVAVLLVFAVGYAAITDGEAEEPPPEPVAQQEVAGEPPREVAVPQEETEASGEEAAEDTVAVLSPSTPVAAAQGPPPLRRAPALGTLQVYSEPAAAVYLAGDSVGTTPLALPRLPAGRHALTLKRSNFPDYETTVRLESGSADTLRVRLWSLVGRVEVQVYPWAEVFVDGVARDDTPAELILEPGEHRLALYYPPGDTMVVDTTFTISAGEEQKLSFRFDDQIVTPPEPAEPDGL